MTIESVRVREFVLEMMPKEAVCAEIGVLHGQFSTRILEITEPKKLYLIDPYLFELYKTKQQVETGLAEQAGQDDMDNRYIHVYKKFGYEVFIGQVSFIRSKSAAACRVFGADFFNWIYIDGDHTVEGALADLRNYTPLVKAGGFITGDDIDRPPFGVTEALELFMQDDLCEKILIKDCQFVLRKK